MRKRNRNLILIITGFIFLCSLAWITPASAQSWSNGYAHRRVITIDHTKVPNTDQTNFPFLFSGTYPYLATTSNGGNVTNSNGYDTIFTSDAAGTSPLAYERESYNPATGAVTYWVAVPTLSHTTDTVIYMFYGNSGITTDQTDKTAVWDSNFVLVSHLSDDAANTTIADSTSNSNNLANVANTSSKMTSGEINSGLAYNGSSDYSTIPNNSSLNLQGPAVTVEVWANPTNTNATNWERMVAKEIPGNFDPYIRYGLLRVAGSSQIGFRVSTGGAGSGVEVDAGSISAGRWTHIVGVYDGSLVKLYANGSLIGSASMTGNIASSTTPLDLARDSETSFEYFNGVLDEVRVSNSARSSDWVATEYNNQNNPSTFYSIDEPDWSNGYSYRNAVTIDHTKVPNTDQTDFPVLVSGVYSYLATVSNGGSVQNTNGYDVVFTSDPDGAIKLDHEIDSYDPVTGTVSYWVRIPALSHTSDTVIYLFYGNSSVTVSQENKPGVWKNNYLSIYHLGNGTSVGTTDSGSSGYNLSGSATAVTGKIGGGASFNGNAGSYLSYEAVNAYPSGSSAVTLEAWVQVASTSSSDIFGYGANSANGSRIALGDSGTAAWMEFENFGVSASETFDTNWHHLVGVYNGGSLSAGSGLVYLDGVLASSTVSGGTPSITTNELKIGGMPTVTFCCSLNGSVDEVRVSSGVRSADWIATEYNNQNNPSSFYSMGASTPAPALTSLSPTSGSTGTSVTITGTNFGSAQGSSTVAFAGVAATPTSWSNTQIVVPVPGGSLSGNVIVNVSNLNSNSLAFTDSSAGILGISPASGEIGTSVTITGVNFGSAQGSSTVTLNGMAMAAPTWSNTQIVAVVPNGASSGYIVVTVSGAASDGAVYTVTVPAIGTLSASSGPTGSSVTISGSNFGAAQGSSTVTFNGTPATPSSWTSTSILVPVPAAATTGNVVVTVGASSSNGVSFSVVPSITALSPSAGLAGTPITITGTGFGSALGTSTVTFNGTSASPISWSDTSILVAVPNGATTGNVVVTVAGLSSAGAYFSLVPNGWLDQDVGFVGVAGNASYSSGTFTVQAGGTDIGGTADAMNFMYQPLPSDGTIVARVVSLTGGGGGAKAGVMIRETLDPSATNAYVFDSTSYSTGQPHPAVEFNDRVTTGGGTNSVAFTDNVARPNWVKAVRSGNTFTAYTSTDGIYWTPYGTTVTISMATSVYVGLAVTGTSTTSLATATFDSVSVTSTATPGPIISGISPTTGPIGSQVVISGSGFGAAPGSSAVTLNAVPLTIDTWSDTSVTISIPTGVTSGDLIVSVAPTMNDSNPVEFAVTTQPLPAGWLDQDVGYVGVLGSATYSGGTFTVQAGGSDIDGTADGMHYVYQPLSGDGTIVARVVSVTGGGSSPKAGVMIRETLDPSSTDANLLDFTTYYTGQPQPAIAFNDRTTTGGGSGGLAGTTYTARPNWFMLIRSGNTFKAYMGTDGVNWTQFGTTQTITMATNVYIGLAVTSNTTSALTTATFDNVAVSSTAAFIVPVINNLAPPAAPLGGTVTLNGAEFGSNQSSSVVSINGVAAYVSSWSGTSIAAVVPNTATSGPVTVMVGGVASNAVQFNVIEAATVSSISPSTGPVGASVTITGTGFGSTQSNSSVNFYGAVATSITSWSDTQIVATAPPNIGTGPMSVTVAGVTVSGPTYMLSRSSQVTDSLGNVSNYSALDIGGVWQPVAEDGSGCSTCTARGTINTTYDSKGNVLTRTDPAGHTTTYTYDSFNDVLTQSVQLNPTTAATTSYSYNFFGEVLTVTDPLGNVTTNAYDANGNLTSVTSPAPNSSTAASVTHFAYNSLGELTTITDPLGHATTMTYTAAGLIATITDAQSNVTTYAYDAKGNRTSVTDALSHQTAFAYDAMSRLTTITYPDSTTSTFAYDSRGRRTSVTDQNAKTTTYAYDDADRLTSVTDAASHVTHYAYDTESNLASITDASSNQTAFTYDAFGRVTQTNFPSSLSEYYQYDADNNLTQKTDRKGQTISYLYDALNRLTSKTYPDTTAVDYTYDLVGKIQQVNDPTGTYAFAYDNMGRLIGTTTSYSFLTSRSFTNAYTYDAASNRTGFTDPESGSTAYSYDTLNRLTSLVPPSAFGSGSFGFSYDALSRRTQMTRPNSVTTNYSYDNLSRLTSVLHQLSGSTIDGASYTLDSAGNRTSKTDQLAAVTSNYTYDAIYQLTQVTQANNTTESYAYDAVGNRTASLGVSSYTTNASNELTATSNASYTYDSNGNTLTKTVGSTTTSYAWDFENRLTSVTLPSSGGTVTFKYDPFGRRIYKSSGSGTSIYTYDGDNLIEETNSSGGVVARYTQTQNIDESLAMLRSSATSYYNADGLGSVTSLTNSAGAAAQTYTYDSFGNVTASSGSLTTPFQYTGRESDPETGLYYYRARYYDPSTGRFVGEDPIEFSGGNNFYSYALNRPAILSDPSGLDGHTWGPFTWYTNQQGMSPTEIQAEKAHEAQHRCDFWNGNVFTKPCEFLESRGFAAEIPILQQRLDDLRKQKTLTPAERHEMQVIIDELSLAQGMSNPKGVMIHYYCNPPGTSTSPSVPTAPKPCTGFSCLDSR